MTREEKINIIIDNFDFQRVGIAMSALKWPWIPSVEEMKKIARKLLNDVYGDGRGCSSYGGFVAELEIEKGYLSLRFEIEECGEY